uniref:Uncharacterized protein n=1 Tax=Megaselia scalaris TaxID=36166 RepID=T1GBK8_MEGSC
MTDSIRRFQVLNSQILATLNKYLKSSDGEESNVKHVRCFLPPQHPTIMSSHYHEPNKLRQQQIQLTQH